MADKAKKMEKVEENEDGKRRRTSSTSLEFRACRICQRVCVSKFVDGPCGVLTFAVVSSIAGGIVGTTPATVDATSSQAAFFAPWRVTVDAGGNIIVGGEDRRIRQVTPAGVVTTLVGGGVGSDGTGTQARFFTPFGVAFDARSGYIIVADANNQCIRMLSPTNGTIVYHGADGAQPQHWLFMTRIVHCILSWCVISGHDVCWAMRRICIF